MRAASYLRLKYLALKTKATRLPVAKWSGQNRVLRALSPRKGSPVRQASRDVVVLARTNGASGVPSWLGYLLGGGSGPVVRELL